MGIIKNGAVSGVLPEAEAFAVHYPGYPSSTSRAIETLGGISEIAQSRSSQPSSLELRFRPEDPNSHPAFGQLRPCTCLLLKMSKKKPNGDFIPATPLHLKASGEAPPADGGNVTGRCGEDSALQLCVDVVARVLQAYEFDGMADYQHVLAVHAAQRKKRNWAEVETNLEKSGLMDLEEEDLMMLVPPFFTLKDIPKNIVLRPSNLLQAKQKMVDVVRDKWEMDIEPCLALDFTKKEIPGNINWERHLHQGSEEWLRQVAVSKLFDERPVWPRRSVKEHLLCDGLEVSDDQLKRLLFRAAYYFSRGPFGKFWIKKGYDPRQDSESRIYQRVEFRVPSQLRKAIDTNSTDESEPSWKDICEFQAFPSKTFSALQLFELADDFIQQEIRKPVEQPNCTFYTGWYSKAMFHTLSLRVSLRFLSLCNKSGSEDLLRSISEKFEKSKLSQVLEKNLRPDKEEERLHANKDSINERVNSSKEVTCDDEEEENDEIENEEFYETLDEYGAYRMDDENMDFSLQEDLNPSGEDIHNNYMHKILRSLPFDKTGMDVSVQDDDSDGEYYTLEPVEDDHLDDDDNEDDD